MSESTNQKRLLWLVAIAGALLVGILFVAFLAPDTERGYAPGPDLRPDTAEAAAPGATTTEPAAEEPSTQAFRLSGSELISLAWRLGLVIVIIGVSIVGLRWWARRTSGPRSVTGFLRVVDTLQVGSGRTIHLVALGDRVIVVGATAQSMAFLNELDAEESERVLQDADAPVDQAFGAFATELMQSLRANRDRAQPTSRNDIIIEDNR